MPCIAACRGSTSAAADHERRRMLLSRRAGNRGVVPMNSMACGVLLLRRVGGKPGFDNSAVELALRDRGEAADEIQHPAIPGQDVGREVMNPARLGGAQQVV